METQSKTPMVRYRETKAFQPFGEPGAPARTMTRVVQSSGPIPPGCEETTDIVCDWNDLQEEN